MGMLKNIKNRPGAKSLSDVEIFDSTWKPDFDIVDRYQSFANELMRIALLGIAGYGFLIKEVYMIDPKFYPTLKETADYFWMGSVALGISLSLVLAHRFFSTSCLFYQIMIMRSLKRLDNPHWSIEEKESERHFLKNARDIQRTKSRTSHYILVSAATFFAIGFLFIIFVFYKFFHNLPA
ncbi:MAG: hypothetical protein ABIN94_22130 [Ferruginibacter sp.]